MRPTVIQMHFEKDVEVKELLESVKVNLGGKYTSSDGVITIELNNQNMKVTNCGFGNWMTDHTYVIFDVEYNGQIEVVAFSEMEIEDILLGHIFYEFNLLRIKGNPVFFWNNESPTVLTVGVCVDRVTHYYEFFALNLREYIEIKLQDKQTNKERD